MVLNKKLFSKKLNGPGLAYLISVCLLTSDIVMIDGPRLPGEFNDILMFRASLRPLLEEGERVEGDDGFVGDDPQFTKTPKGFGRDRGTEERVALKKRVDGRQEHINTNWTTFECMRAKPWRHNLDQHQTCFRAIAVITQVAIELGEFKLSNLGDGYIS